MSIIVMFEPMRRRIIDVYILIDWNVTNVTAMGLLGLGLPFIDLIVSMYSIANDSRQVLFKEKLIRGGGAHAGYIWMLWRCLKWKAKFRIGCPRTIPGNVTIVLYQLAKIL